jgi:hypothetical protein
VVSEPGGLEFELWPRIIPLRIITAYRSPYGGARVAQTSGSGWHTVGGMLEPDKWPPASYISPEFYGWIGSSSMVLEPRSWVQFPPVTYFLSLHVIILTYLGVC